jgi:hypothetical protein
MPVMFGDLQIRRSKSGEPSPKSMLFLVIFFAKYSKRNPCRSHSLNFFLFLLAKFCTITKGWLQAVVFLGEKNVFGKLLQTF